MDKYLKIKEFSAEAYEFALNALKEVPQGNRYDFADGAFAAMNVYTTKKREDGCFEAHKKYIDIQMMLVGSENIITENIETMHKYECIKPFEDGDIELFKMNDEGKDNILNPGDFIVLLPEDAHAPGVCVNEPEDVVKIVFKIPVKQS